MVARQAGARGPRPELADIVRAHGSAFRATHRLCSAQYRTLRAIEHCRTAALGGEVRQCDACGVQRYVDYAHANRRKIMELEPTEFLRRFSLHVLPRGFNRIRHYGLLSNRNKRALLARARAALAAPTPTQQIAAPESIRAFWLRIAGIDIERCPHCQRGTLRTLRQLPPHSHSPP